EAGEFDARDRVARRHSRTSAVPALLRRGPPGPSRPEKNPYFHRRLSILPACIFRQGVHLPSAPVNESYAILIRSSGQCCDAFPIPGRASYEKNPRKSYAYSSHIVVIARVRATGPPDATAVSLKQSPKEERNLKCGIS